MSKGSLVKAANPIKYVIYVIPKFFIILFILETLLGTKDAKKQVKYRSVIFLNNKPTTSNFI